MSERLSDKDLERIHDLAERDEWDFLSPAEVLALTTELRERRAPEPSADEAKDQLANLTARIDQLKVEQANAPLDTGRWEQQGEIWALPIQDDDRGLKRWARLWCVPGLDLPDFGYPATWMICTDDGGYAEITAEDLEAASRIIRAEEAKRDAE